MWLSGRVPPCVHKALGPTPGRVNKDRGSCKVGVNAVVGCCVQVSMGKQSFLKGKSLAIKNIKQNRIDDLEELGWEWNHGLRSFPPYPCSFAAGEDRTR